jgi:organic hydroperoxide reductase OsmC/OhrA
MHKQHNYQVAVNWSGNMGTGTADYKGYERSHTIAGEGKAVIEGTSDPAFRGDKSKYNPEEFLVASLSTCHMLTYLHQCAIAGVVVTEYSDGATGTMEETPDGGGHFTEVTLHPVVTVKDAAMIDKAKALHHQAGKLCFIAASVNFPVHHEPTIKV